MQPGYYYKIVANKVPHTKSIRPNGASSIETGHVVYIFGAPSIETGHVAYILFGASSIETGHVAYII